MYVCMCIYIYIHMYEHVLVYIHIHTLHRSVQSHPGVRALKQERLAQVRDYDYMAYYALVYYINICYISVLLLYYYIYYQGVGQACKRRSSLPGQGPGSRAWGTLKTIVQLVRNLH